MNASFENSLRKSDIQKKQDQQKLAPFTLSEQEQEIKQFFEAKPSIQPQKVANGKLDFLFVPNKQLDQLKPYVEDGDQTMYTQENLKRRRMLRMDTEVIFAIESFMQHYTFSGEKLVKNQYLKQHIRLATLLRNDLDSQDPEDIEDLKMLFEEDWDHDSRSKGYMSKQDLFDSLFELVDIWTPDASKDQYVGFFQILESKYQEQSVDKLEELYYKIIE